MLPAAASVTPDLDFQTLRERYDMSGGYIMNAALRAAFFAAEEGAPIAARPLDYAARGECTAMGKLAC